MRMIPKMHPKTCPMDQYYYCPLGIVQLVATTNHEGECISQQNVPE